MPDFSSKPVCGFCFCSFHILNISRLSRLCLCLLAGLNVHRHADCPRLSVTVCMLLPCEPLFCMHSIAAKSTFWNQICLQTCKHTFNPLLLSKHQSTLCRHVCPLLWIQHSRVSIQVWTAKDIQVFLSPAWDWHGSVKVHLYSSSLFSRVCAVSFVSCLPGSKSWEHNGPCLGLDNSPYEWEWGGGGSDGERETERQKGATGSSLHSPL